MAKAKAARGEELNAIGKQLMAHAYSAMDYYFDHLKKTVASAPSGGTEFGEKVKAYAEQNISATQEYVRELTYAKDIQDMLRIQMEFMRCQLKAFGEQANDLNEAYIKAASGQTKKPPQSGGELCPRFYRPELGSEPDSPFARDANNKLVRRSYWLDMNDRSLVMVMTRALGRI